MYEIEVHHTIDAAHRVVGHVDPDGQIGKCARLHGHTYAFDVTIRGSFVDDTGFVVDFANVKALLNRWDHRLLLWERDPFLVSMEFREGARDAVRVLADEMTGVERLAFNPTAENMAEYLARCYADMDGATLATVTVRETPKTAATFTCSEHDAERMFASGKRVGVVERL